jgi:hypothetical protein
VSIGFEADNRLGVLRECLAILTELHGSSSTVSNLLELADWVLADG